MAVLEAYLKGWEALMKHLRMWGLLYVVNLLLAFTAVLPFSGLLGETVAQSLGLERSLDGFDFGLLGDFMNNYGQPFSVVLDQAKGGVLLFFLASLFLMGGVLQSLVHSTRIFAYYDFWKGCGQYFWRLVRLTLYFFIFQSILFLCCFFLFQMIAGSLSPFELESEVPVIRAFWIVVPIWLSISTLLLLIQDCAKIRMVHKNEFWLVFVIRDSIRFVLSNFIRTYFLYLLYALTFLLLSFLYMKANRLFQANSTGTIIGMFLLGQLFILMRVGFKIAILGGLNFLYKTQKR